MELDGTPIIDRVVATARAVRDYVKREDNISIDIAVLVPECDPIGEHLEAQSLRTLVVYGSEKNVLSRYQKALDIFPSDLVVRLTGDCPMLPPYVIYKHIKTAAVRRADYIENVWPELRTSPDGHDVEVLSSKALRWLTDCVRDDYDREHVTTLLRRVKPDCLKYVHIGSTIDYSDVKLSVDTPEDFEKVQTLIRKMERKATLLESVTEKDNFERYMI
jgi:spore coat polysaccharide biosynthesis protein SpsF (cytidylyltransferase family)